MTPAADVAGPLLLLPLGSGDVPAAQRALRAYSRMPLLGASAARRSQDLAALERLDDALTALTADPAGHTARTTPADLRGLVHVSTYVESAEQHLVDLFTSAATGDRTMCRRPVGFVWDHDRGLTICSRCAQAVARLLLSGLEPTEAR